MKNCLSHSCACSCFHRFHLSDFPYLFEGENESHSVVSNFLGPMGCSPWNFPGKNTWVGSQDPLLQGIFSTQGSNPTVPHCRQILCQLSCKGSPRILEWIVYPFSSRSSWLRNWTRMSCIAGRFFTNWVIREALKWPSSNLWKQNELLYMNQEGKNWTSIHFRFSGGVFNKKINRRKK